MCRSLFKDCAHWNVLDERDEDGNTFFLRVAKVSLQPCEVFKAISLRADDFTVRNYQDEDALFLLATRDRTSCATSGQYQGLQWLLENGADIFTHPRACMVGEDMDNILTTLHQRDTSLRDSWYLALEKHEGLIEDDAERRLFETWRERYPKYEPG